MTFHAPQRGMALLVSLMLLLLLTVIAISAANMSSVQQRLAINSQNRNVAFQASESGLAAWIENYARTGIALDTRAAPRTLEDEDNNVVATFAVSSSDPIIVPPGIGGSIGTENPEFRTYPITSLAVACGSDTSACDPGTDNGYARAKHMQGYEQRRVK
ncbi:PilX N-terminal domain-containing pilus assembly protein [Pseudomonas denitrificans (nom. rej.)]|nr:PilX N-terminal domain-containing pilus assembly protein [Pseudomonas denitrificans (nom. rej.)]